MDLVPGQRGAGIPGEQESRDGQGLAPPPAILSEENKQLSASQGSLRSIDNDSSATMSADEGKAGATQHLHPDKSLLPSSPSRPAIW